MNVALRVDRRAKIARSPLRRRTRLLWIIVPAIVAIAVAVGSQRVPCGGASGTGLRPAAVATKKMPATLRVATFNIHGGKGTDRVRDLNRTADCLRSFHLIGLNEVHGACLGRSENQAQSLGRALEMDWLFAPTEQRWWHYRFGNGLLSSLPVEHWQRIPLERVHGKSFRNLLVSNIELDGRTVHVVITHIDRSDDRERVEQLRTVAELFLSLAEPAILMGDMNSSAEEPLIRRLLQSPGVRDPVADVLGDQAPPRIDWILTRGLRTVDAGIIETAASDHPCVWAELAPIE